MSLSNEPDESATVDDLFDSTSRVEERTARQKFADSVHTHVVVPGRIILGDSRGVIGLTILVGIVLMGTVGVWVIPEPSVMRFTPLLPAFQSWKYPLGTGPLGQSIFRQVVHATPAMLKLVISGALVSVVIGTVVGTIAGYKSGIVDYFMMMISDTFMSIPALVVVIFLASVYDPESPIVVGMILGINFWPNLARTVRSEVLSLREESVIEAARVMGLSNLYIVRKYVIKNLMPYITVNAANSARAVIFESIALYFIGVLSISGSNWGVMLNQAYNNSDLTDLSELHWLLVPICMIVLLTLGIILTAQAADSLFAVKLRARHENDSDENWVE